MATPVAVIADGKIKYQDSNLESRHSLTSDQAYNLDKTRAEQPGKHPYMSWDNWEAKTSVEDHMPAHLSAVPQQDLTQDAGGQVYFGRQLQYRDPNVLVRRFPELGFSDAGGLLPVTYDIPAGARSVLQEVMESYGRASDGAVLSNADDFPLVNEDMAEIEDNVIAYTIGYEYLWSEIRSASYGQRDISSYRQEAARRALEERINLHGAYGNTKYNMRGLVNHPGHQQSVSALNVYAAATTADDMTQLILQPLINMDTNSLNTSITDTIILPRRLLGALLMLRIPNTTATALSYLVEQITTFVRRPIQILQTPELNQAPYVQYGGGAADEETIIYYRRNPESIKRRSESASAGMLPSEGMVGGKVTERMFKITTGTRVYHQQDSLQLTYKTA